MSRFDRPRDIAREAKATNAAVTRRRSGRDAEPMTRNDSREPSPASGKTASEADASHRFRVRFHVTLDANDPLGALLAERYDALPENQRQWFDPGKIVRRAVLDALPEIAGKLR